MPTRSLGGAEYFVMLIDDATRKVWAYPMARKSDAFNVFQKWLALVEKQSDGKLKCLWTDNGEEYISDDFQHFCDTRGIRSCRKDEPNYLGEDAVYAFSC